MSFQLNDVVAVLCDLPGAAVKRGEQGTVVAILEQPYLAFEVEFCDSRGATIRQLTLGPADLLLIARTATP